jgi:ribosomal protein S18 acetylase RimI-like enzyme
MNISKATSQDIPTLLALTKACANQMISKGIYQWNENYPSQQAFENDLQLAQLYTLKNQGNIIACIVISEVMDEEYHAIQWSTSNRRNIYIHRLAVHPKHQGKGCAQQLMQFAEHYAKTNKFPAVRLDTFSQNPRNNIFYQKRGYKKLGDVFFPKQSSYPFHCYELVFD